MKQQTNIGWECPKCDRCYSPYKTECSYCQPGTSGTINISASTNNALLHPFELDEKSSGNVCKICGVQEWQHTLFTNTI